MMEKKYSNFELLLRAASEDVVNDMIEEYINIDTTGVTISQKTIRKIERMIRARKRKARNYRPLRIAIVACLVILSMAFSACMFIPPIREAITNVIVQWYDEYFSVGFGDESDTVTTKPEPEEIIPDTPPTSIEKKAAAMYLPEGYSYVVVNESPTVYELHYNDSTGNLVFILSQITIDGDLLWNDSSNTTAQEVTVNGHKAFLISYAEEPNIYTLIWQDYYYQYSIYGYFEEIDELMKIAEGIRTR